MATNPMAPVIDPVEALIDAWCERRELKLLALLLPAWINNFGLTDGWMAVLEALRDVRARQWLTPSDREVIESVIPLVEQALERS